METVGDNRSHSPGSSLNKVGPSQLMWAGAKFQSHIIGADNGDDLIATAVKFNKVGRNDGHERLLCTTPFNTHSLIKILIAWDFITSFFKLILGIQMEKLGSGRSRRCRECVAESAS